MNKTKVTIKIKDIILLENFSQNLTIFIPPPPPQKNGPLAGLAAGGGGGGGKIFKIE